MKYHECHKTRKPVGRLPLFPSPYPGESIYSLLCRYHVRSGNVNDRYTIRQLFGYNSSLGSTLLSPYHLEKAKKWLGSGASISTETLLQKNTAFPLFSVTAAEYELSRICDMISGKVESTTYPRWVQIRLLHPSGRLRYCPACAAAQKKLYGEAYWQVLPQLDGVEYCPVHGIRIKNSTISLKDIRYKFYPASDVLKPMLYADQGSKDIQSELFSFEREIFIGLAQGLDWLHQNGIHYKGIQKIYRNYNRILGRSDNRYWPAINRNELRRIFSENHQTDGPYRYLMSKVSSVMNDGTIFLYCIPLCGHVMIMNAVSGSPQNFYAVP